MSKFIIWFENLTIADVDKVGGKNASLGEMIQSLSVESDDKNLNNIKVPGGFATTADAFWLYLSENNLKERIFTLLDGLDTSNMSALQKAGKDIRTWIEDGVFPAELTRDITDAYQELSNRYGKQSSYAVRSSATAEDLPEASFAGQQETYLNVCGLDNILNSIKKVFASLYTDRAISYRVHQGFKHESVALSAGVQKMIRSDLASSGVMFTLDTESGFENVVFITSAYGLGETVVQGSVNPDEFYLFKPSLAAGKYPIIKRNIGSKAIRMIYAADESNSKTLIEEVDLASRSRFSITDQEAITLAEHAMMIEKHYAGHMDIEWAKDGIDNQLYIVQARPETVKSQKRKTVLQQYNLLEKGDVLVTGRSIGQRIGSGVSRVVNGVSEIDRVEVGDILVTDMTDPDWEPVMKKASAIITNRGGRTCHAAIIARELGIPAIVGCEHATDKIVEGQAVTASCAEGDIGYVYSGILEYAIEETEIGQLSETDVKLKLNVASPERAFDFSFLPNKGVGLARLEFIINQMIGVHPKALLAYDKLDKETKDIITGHIVGYDSPINYYINRLSEGIATITAAFYPKPVIVRLSDFKTNEYANLIGGSLYELKEENPMIGFRGASRYISEQFRECFELECKAVLKVRNEMGLNNLDIMIPFVRTVAEAKKIIELLELNGLKRGENGLRIIMMCEIPSNALLVEQFLDYFDGFSIGSNDLTQLCLGVDRDSQLVAHEFDERNDAVKALIEIVIKACKARGKYIGICGQGPSDYPDFAKWLIQQGIENMSLNPDSIVKTWMMLSKEK